MQNTNIYIRIFCKYIEMCKLKLLFSVVLLLLFTLLHLKVRLQWYT